MSPKGKPFFRHVLTSLVVLLSLIAVFIALRLTTAEYPTHSDVFYMGVEFGALAITFLLCLSLIGLFLYRLATLMRRPYAWA